ncbi:MAG: peptidase M20, partial [Acidobacteriota bacterium]
MDTRGLFELAEAELPRATGILCEWVGMPSVSARREKLREGAELAARIARDEGFRVEIWEGPGAPVVHGELPAPAGAPTLLF